MREVEDVLVVRVRVDRGHQAALDAEGVVDRLGHRGQAVRGAGRVGDHAVLGGVVVLVIDAHDDRDVLVLRRSGDDDLLRAGRDVALGLLGVGEVARRLDDDVGADLGPGQVGRVALGEHGDRLAVDDDGAVARLHGGVEPTEDRVVLRQVRQGLGVRQVVDADDFDVSPLREQGAEVVAADTTEAIDADIDSHEISSGM